MAESLGQKSGGGQGRVGQVSGLFSESRRSKEAAHVACLKHILAELGFHQV
jgi:hypothetical protein